MRILVLSILLCISIISKGQKTEYDHISTGNKLYKDSSFVEARTEYQEAYKLNGNSFEAVFNLGNALYKQDSLEAAAHQFRLASTMSDDKLKQAEAFHNLGNTYLKQKDYQKSIDAYKDALRRNSKDEDTRYNLSYARKMLDNQDQNKDDQNKDDQNKDDQENKDQDQNKDDKDQGDKDGDNKDQKDQKEDSKDQDQKKDQGDDKRDQDKQQNQKDQNKPGMSPEDAEKMLNALEQDESELRKGIRIQEDKTDPKLIDKNW
jgi:Ca-activated chloride channel family protein